MKRVVFHVAQRRGSPGWWIVVDAGLTLRAPLQDQAVKRAVSLAREHEAAGGHAQVVLHGRNGRIRWERTYPDTTPRRRG